MRKEYNRSTCYRVIPTNKARLYFTSHVWKRWGRIIQLLFQDHIQGDWLRLSGERQEIGWDVHLIGLKAPVLLQEDRGIHILRSESRTELRHNVPGGGEDPFAGYGCSSHAQYLPCHLCQVHKARRILRPPHQRICRGWKSSLSKESLHLLLNGYGR